ncbi:MAG TPA: Hsp20/alpha crystallin family protein [Myxococcota bacterium]|nr:Hsp20/alpha crystallin family protein [Myxococcota bacterium]
MAQYSVFRPWATAGSRSGTLDELRREMEGLFNQFGVARPGRARWGGVFPAVNLYEDGSQYVLTTELPGVNADEIEVSIEGSTLTLSGQKRIDYSNLEGASIHRRERQSGSFRRAFELPSVIDADKVEARTRNGVLMLRLPKSPEYQPRQIAVKAS